ncbi:MAG: family 78 glycoside hydrolase catalytic domain [Thermoguttaceae bacterium]|nr:family 78 glycoside hydrolase catalytic domain [Thermoguttaceae bacterium]
MSKERNYRRRFWRSTALLTLATTLGFAAATSFSVATDVMPSPTYPISSVGLSVSDFKVEGLTAPEGIDVARPRFSWKLFSQDLNEGQSAYQLKVAKEFGDRVLVWDSGRVESDEQLFVEYDGKPLEPATEYSVELVVWNKDGSRKSQIFGCFSTGLFATDANPNPWKGKWIGLSSTAPEIEPADIKKSSWIAFQDTFSLPSGFSTYRFSFDVADKAEIAAAVANFSADNSSYIYLNGEELGGSDEYRFAATRDMKSLLRDGKNVIVIKVNNVGGSPNPGGLLGAFYLRDKSGKQTDYITDESWKSIEGFDERYIAPEFDDSKWGNSFVLAACDADPWKTVETAPAELPVPARYLSKVYEVRQDVEVERAVVFMSGLGYSECYLNGLKLGDQICGPMFTDYDKRVPYVTYDATDVFKATKAVGADEIEVGVTLGNGRFYAPRIDKCVHYGLPRLLFQMQVEYADGTTDIFVSDETWKGTDAGPILENNDYDGEVYDARRATVIDPNSDAAKYVDGTSRFVETRFGKSVAIATDRQVEIFDAPKGKLVAQSIPAMRKTVEVKPKSVKEIAPGKWIFDFGQNLVGVPCLRVQGQAGTEVKMRFAETLIPDGPKAGNLYVANLRTAKQRDIYVLRGDSTQEVYEPRFTHHGFRYAELTGYPGTPDLNTLTANALNTDLPVVGAFETSNETINQIYSNIVWGTRGNYLHMPTDCPQRDERMGWQGDRAAESKGEMYIFDANTMYNKWMQDVEDSQMENGNVADVCPAYWRFYSPNVTWPSAQVIIPQTLAVMTGDSRAIAKHYDSRKKWLDYMLSLVDEDGTTSKDNYGDWCVPPERKELIHSEDPSRRTNPSLVATAYLIYDMKIVADFAEKLGKKEDADFYRARAAEMTKAFNDKFYNAEKGVYDNATQTSCVLPLYFGIVPEGDREKVFATLTQNIESVTNMHVGTGLIGGQWSNRVLSDMGRIDIPFAFATNRDYPSWGYMIEKGATTIWELWNGDTADPAMNSGNHVMLVGDLGVWFYEYLAGIKADENSLGFKRIIMRPNVVGDLTYVKAKHESPRGLIISDWKIDENGTFVWSVAVPPNTTALVSVPTTKPESLSIRSTRLKIVPPEPGEIRGVKYERIFAPFDAASLEKTTTDGRVEFELGSGFYEITAELQR